MTKEEIGKLLKLIVAAYDNFRVTKEKIELWAELLQDVDETDAVTALKRHIKTNGFLPTIADIRESTGANESKRVVYR